MLQYKDWIELESKVPDYLKEIVLLCARFYKVADNDVLGKEIVLPRPVFELLGLIEKILNHYRGFVKEQLGLDKEKITDIEKRLDGFLDQKTFVTSGKEKRPFDASYWMNDTSAKANSLVMGLDVFLDGVIYSGLKETYNHSTEKKTFLNYFVNLSSNKLGLPRRQDEKSMEDLFGEPEEKKETKKKKKEDE